MQLGVDMPTLAFSKLKRFLIYPKKDEPKLGPCIPSTTKTLINQELRNLSIKFQDSISFSHLSFQIKLIELMNPKLPNNKAHAQ